MPVSHSFSITPLARVLKLVTLAPLLLLSPTGLAQTLIENGTSKTIDASTKIDDYLVETESKLTANGATTHHIRASGASTIDLSNTQVTAQGNANGLDLTGSTATIANGSKIVSSNVGLRLARSADRASSAVVSDSEIIGGRVGASLSALSQLTLQGSTVTGSNANGVGVQSFGGQIAATDSSIVGGRNGVYLFADLNLSADNALILNNSHVEGLAGSAIFIDGQTQTNDERVNVEVNNGSTLVGGNGTLVEVVNSSSANFKADNSQLIGDIIVEQGSSADVVFDNFATLTGRLENVQSLAVNNDARWIMVGDGEVEKLSMNGGGIQFGNPGEFFKLTVGELSGNGTFFMHTNFATGQVDTLTVTGTATGSHQVALDSSGSEPGAAASIPVVHIGGGDAQFSLYGGEVDLGAYSYNLIKQGDNDWYLNTASKIISPGTQSVIALFNAAPTVWYGELSTLRSRMGEVRRDQGKAGGWIRTYGNKFDVNASSGVAYKQTQQGLSFGADAPLPMGDGQWLVGMLGGYSKSDLDLSRGTTGEVDSYYLGAYTTWLDEDSGYYFDGVLKFNRFQNESKVQLSDGKKTKGNYDSHGVGASLEFGRHIKLADDYFVEPYTQLSGVIIQGKDYDLDNGLSAEGDRTHSLLGKVGATVGRNFNLGEGKVVQPYLRAAYAHEFAKNNEVKVNDNAFNNDLSGSRGELGAGVAMTVTDKVSVHADFDYSNGNKIDQPWGANVGVRYSW
ncbi:autotransporter outer membrane beta-barrel domain-containing protein [Pseudomonas sp. RGM2987]|uniref:autotransporter outer membrane beta-barrel domain-containing protein n=1 Tax=Pseudomonas sp. RGM2987 TaxID=2930090 RepID=UPI001FD72489|nr:autotransporter outer membrane beta-barrel domain-containing protein [Pseudomonas sp. RGM2987]MCJ8205288.1 autotransporter outer membrane beta-barrel domain-containing protein [Pseudomonas sp. RGM2987]